MSNSTYEMPAALGGEPQVLQRPRWVIYVAILIVVGGITGWAMMTFVAPPMMESASKGHSAIGALNHYFQPKGHADHEKWLSRVAKLARTVIVCSIVLASVVMLLTSRWFARKLAGTATPGQVGATRALVCGTLLMSALWEDPASTAYLPREMIRSMGTMNFVRKLPMFDQFLASHSAILTWNWMTCAFLFLGMLGIYSRTVIPLAAIFYFVQAGILRQFTWFWHVGLIPLLVLFALSFMPNNDGFSLDRRRRIARGKPVADADLATPFYGWCIWFCWLPVCMAYLWAGMSKVAYGGWFWWRPDNLRGIIIQDSLQPMQFDTQIGQNLVQAPAILFAIIGISAIIGEAAGILPILAPRESKAGKIIRFIVPATLAGMHIGIWVMQNILFFDLIFIQLMFIDWIGLRNFAADKLGLQFLARREIKNVEPEDVVPPAVLTMEQSSRAPSSTVASLFRRPPHLYVKLAVCLFIALWTSVWVNRVEFFPLTSVQMYTKTDRELGTIYYTRVVAHYADGHSGRAYLEQGIGALADGRYRRVLDYALSNSKKDQALADRVLKTCGSRMNRDATSPDQKIEQFEVQRLVWNYNRDPDSPEKGKVTYRRFTDVGASSPSVITASNPL